MNIMTFVTQCIGMTPKDEKWLYITASVILIVLVVFMTSLLSKIIKCIMG